RRGWRRSRRDDRGRRGRVAGDVEGREVRRREADPPRRRGRGRRERGALDADRSALARDGVEVVRRQRALVDTGGGQVGLGVGHAEADRQGELADRVAGVGIERVADYDPQRVEVADGRRAAQGVAAAAVASAAAAAVGGRRRRAGIIGGAAQGTGGWATTGWGVPAGRLRPRGGRDGLGGRDVVPGAGGGAGDAGAAGGGAGAAVRGGRPAVPVRRLGVRRAAGGDGALQLGFRGVTWAALVSSGLWSSSFGRVLALKLGLVVAMLGVSLYHDLVLGPASAGSEEA